MCFNPINRLYVTLVSLSILLLSPLMVLGESYDTQELIHLKQKLEHRISEITQNKALMKQIIREGKARTVLCNTCHGEDGIAILALTPNLAGQNPVYIVDQFQRFGDGRRNDYLMSNLSRTFTVEDKIKIALYYESMAMVSSKGGDPSLLPLGKVIYQNNCVECHGEDGRGQKGYARLAGQRHDYIAKMLKEFRDRTGKRFNIWMTNVAVRLNDQDINAVATYLAHLE
jgi:cytochrome c553